MGRLCRAVLVVGVVAGFLAAPAHATYPGANGKILGSGGCNLWVVNPDGTGQQQLTFEPCPGNDPTRNAEWSPDGTKIAFSFNQDIYVMNADGSGRTQLTNTQAGRVYEDTPRWSPDGTRIAYGRIESVDGESSRVELWVMNADGTDQTRLVNDMCSAEQPHWFPDGSRIVFSGYETRPPGAINCTNPGTWTINPDGTDRTPFRAHNGDISPDGTHVVYGDANVFVQNIDGSPPVQLTEDSGTRNDRPVWSPDGTKIAFASNRDDRRELRLYTMNADGSDEMRVTTLTTRAISWQSIPVNAYPRPKSARPIQVTLVPAYEPCTTPNRLHGTPLTYDSCSPPQQSSSELTVGTPDANGNGANSTSWLLIDPVPGLSTPEDEADIRLRGQIKDVRLTSDLSDYAGALEARVSLRITDKDNTPHPGGPGAATVTDSTYSFPFSCVATAATGIGGECNVDTTAEALVPGTAKEGRRAVWQLGQVQVHDGAGDVFMRQGIFLP